MSFLLDTDHISILQLQTGTECTTLTARLLTCGRDEIAFPVVSFHEQVLGAHSLINRSTSSADIVRGYAILSRTLRSFVGAFVLPYDAAAAGVYADLHARKLRVPTMDLRIAAIALSQGRWLLTRNARDFGRIPELVTADWTR